MPPNSFPQSSARFSQTAIAWARLVLWHASCFVVRAARRSDGLRRATPMEFRAFLVQGVGRRSAQAAKCAPARCRNCRRRVGRSIHLGGKAPSLGRCTEDTANGLTEPEGQRGTSSVLGRDRLWQRARWNARRRIRPVRHRERTGGKTPATTVPGLSGRGERQRGFSAKSRSSASRGSIVRRVHTATTASPHPRGMELPPFPSFLSRDETQDAGTARNLPHFFPDPIAPWMMFPRTPESVPSGKTAIWTLEASSLLTRKEA
jgi:hypothetical protein